MAETKKNSNLLPLNLSRIIAHLILTQNITSPFPILSLPSSNGATVAGNCYVEIIIFRINKCADRTGTSSRWLSEGYQCLTRSRRRRG